MSTASYSPYDPKNADRDSTVRATILNHMMTISKMSNVIDAMPDSELLRGRLISSLHALGVPQESLAQLSGSVDIDAAVIQKLDVAPIVAFALLRASRQLLEQKKFETAQELMSSFVATAPQHAEAHYLLARAEVGLMHFDVAEALFLRAIELDAGRLESHSGLATLYERTENYAAADKTWRGAFQFGAMSKRQYLGNDPEPIRLLVITSVLAGNIRFMRFLNNREFSITSIIAESYTPNVFLPEHDVLLQAIGDTELCVRGVQIAREIAARSKAPLINDPSRVMLTSREDNSERFRSIPNVTTPLTKTFERTQILAETAEQMLFDCGFAYPILLRSPGYFNGRFFEKAESREDLARIAADLPGAKLIVIQYIDTMLADGTIRKYRMMGIDKKLYPIHLAISYNWKIHYFSANMGDKQDFRNEELAYLENPASVLGPQVMQALAAIVETMGLDYCGIDFTVNNAGEVIVFEANATMALLLPEDLPQWKYRRAPIQVALDAAKNLIYTRVPKKAATDAKLMKSKATVTRQKKRRTRKSCG